MQATAEIPEDEAYEELARLEFQDCAASCDYFIQCHVKIEDVDLSLIDLKKHDEDETDPEEKPDGIAIPFRLWPKQLEVLVAFLTERLIVILKSRQLGQTWLVLAYAAWRMIFFPGYSVIAISKREQPDAKELIRRLKFILKKLPPFIVRPVSKDIYVHYTGPTWEATALTVTIYHRDIETGAEKDPSTFQSLTSSPATGRSFTANLVFLDEWAYQPWAEEIWTSAYPTINRPTGGQVIGLSTNQRGSLFETFCMTAINALKDTTGKIRSIFKLVFLSWRSDPRRDQQWYEDSKLAFPATYRQEYPETPEDAFSAGEMTAFPEFSVLIHVLRPDEVFVPAKHWRRWRSCDNGYSDPFAWYGFTVSEDGIVYICWEYTREPKAAQVYYSDQAQEIVRLSTKMEIDEETGQVKPVEEAYDFIAAGHDAWATNVRDQQGKTIVDYYHDGGLKNFIQGLQDRIQRKAVWHEYLKPFPHPDQEQFPGRMISKVQIFPCCRKLIETMPLLLKDENESEKVAEMDIDHWYEGSSYGLVAHHTKQSKPLPESKTRIQEHKERLKKATRWNRRKLM